MDDFEKHRKEYFDSMIKPTQFPREHFYDWVKFYKAWDEAGIAQLPEQVKLLLETINNFKIQTVIELGIMGGGMSLMLLERAEAFPGFKYYGIEKDPQFISDKVLNMPEIIIGNIFERPIQDVILTLISSASGNVLVFCDNGNKPKELETYAPLIHHGDFIMAHDHPGEVTNEFLDIFCPSHPYLNEVQRDLYRDFGYVLFQRVK